MAALALAAASEAQPPGPKGGPPRAEGRGRPGDGARRFGGPGGPPALERALDDLKLSDQKKEKAEVALKAHQETVRKLIDLARSDLLVKMQVVLSEQEFKTFTAGLDRRPGPGRGGRGAAGRRGVTVDQIVERILSFDKNKDGKVTKDELPERMQDLIAKGDTNKDGALDKDEIKKLATDLARDGSFRGFEGRGGPGGGLRPGRGGRVPPGSGFERALADLNLSEKKKDQAEGVVKAHQETLPKLMDLARSDLLLKMKEILTEQELKSFKAAVDRQPGLGARPVSPPLSTSRSGDLEKKLDQLQKDLDSLRREIRR
jgi:hypothetical protein